MYIFTPILHYFSCVEDRQEDYTETDVQIIDSDVHTECAGDRKELWFSFWIPVVCLYVCIYLFLKIIIYLCKNVSSPPLYCHDSVEDW